MKFPIPLLLGALLLPTPAREQAPELRGKAYYRALHQAMDPLYRLEYDEAIERLTRLGERFPEHPGPPLAKAGAIWLRELFRRQELDLDRFVSPGYFTKPTEKEMPEEERKAFESSIEASQELAGQILEAHPENVDAHYYLGGAEGILGSFAFTIERSKFDALRHGKKAYEYHRSVIDGDPSYHDAYMTVGTYEYLVDNLPWYIKWIAVIAGYTGDERLGFEYLIRAAEKGHTVDVDARVLLMLLYVREQNFDYALDLARQLHRKYPENFLFHLNRAQILEKMDRPSEAFELYRDVEQRAAEGAPNYDELPLGRFRFTLGEKLFAAGQFEQALPLFDRASESRDIPQTERALALLRAGQVLDLLGRRDEALSRYRRVHKLPDVKGSHDDASRYLRAPYER